MRTVEATPNALSTRDLTMFPRAIGPQCAVRQWGSIPVADLDTVGFGDGCTAADHVCNRRDSVSDVNLLGDLGADA